MNVPNMLNLVNCLDLFLFGIILGGGWALGHWTVSRILGKVFR